MLVPQIVSARPSLGFFGWRACVMSLFALAVALTHAQTYSDLHDFGGVVTEAGGGTGPDGREPQAAVIFDSAGNMYGTAAQGGQFDQQFGGYGSVWEITASGAYIDLHDFGGPVTNADGAVGPDGEVPTGTIAMDKAGNLYGTAMLGGPNYVAAGGYGMVWEITTAGKYIDLHDFGGSISDANGAPAPDGLIPVGDVTIDGAGNLYGTTRFGGRTYRNSGIVWEISSAGVYIDLHDFQVAEGESPMCGVKLDAGGNIFGTTSLGGANNCGTVWELTTAGEILDLHDFGGTVLNANGMIGPDGIGPMASPTFDSSGNLYGTASLGGPNNGAGMVWELTAAGTYLDLHDFGGIITNADGASGPDAITPNGAVAFDSAGNMFGTASRGGLNGTFAGLLWEITPLGFYVDFHDFGAKLTNGSGEVDGGSPDGAVAIDAFGTLYGTAYYGGANYHGLVWRFDPPSPELVNFTLDPSSVLGGKPSIGTLTISRPAPVGGQAVDLSSNNFDTTLPSVVTIPAGATTATFTVDTGAVNGRQTATISAKAGVTLTATLIITTPSVIGIVLTPTSVYGSVSVAGIVTLNVPAPPGGIAVALSSNSTSVNVPASVTVSGGASTARFTVSTVPVDGITKATLSATLNRTVSAALVVNPPILSKLALSPIEVVGGVSAIGTVALNDPAGPSGVIVRLFCSRGASAPATVVVPSGAAFVTFPVSTGAVSEPITVSVTASEGGKRLMVMLTVHPVILKSLTVSPGDVAGDRSSTGTIRLSAPAPSGGSMVALSSNNGAVNVPATVTVLAGANSVSFTVTTIAVASTTAVTVTATQGSLSVTAILKVHAP